MCSRFVKCMFVFAELGFELTYKNVLEALLQRDVAFIEILPTGISINEFKFYIHRRMSDKVQSKFYQTSLLH